MEHELVLWTKKALMRLMKWEVSQVAPTPGEGMEIIGASSWRTMHYRGYGLDVYRREYRHDDVLPPYIKRRVTNIDQHDYWNYLYSFRVVHEAFEIRISLDPEWIYETEERQQIRLRQRLVELHTLAFDIRGDAKVARSTFAYLILLLEPHTSKRG